MKTLIKILTIGIISIAVNGCCNAEAQINGIEMYKFATVEDNTVYAKRDVINNAVVYVITDENGNFLDMEVRGK